MADEVGKRVLFDSATLERAQSAAKERGMTLNRLVGLAVSHFCDRLLPADEVVWTYRDVTLPDDRTDTPQPDREGV